MPTADDPPLSEMPEDVMKRTYTSEFRACATCVHWFGPRRVQLGGRWVEADSDARGDCNHPMRVGMTVTASESCGRWEKNGSLR